MASRRLPSPSRPAVAVTIAASDSGGGAGIQADLATFTAHGVFGATVLTAATAQNTRGIRGTEPISPGFVRLQMDAVFPDLRPAAVKIGMLVDAAHVREVALGLARHSARRVVLDPVLSAKDGTSLLARTALSVLRRKLISRCDLVTPNLPEAAVLAGIPLLEISDRRRAAGILADLGARAVLIKGGHAHGAVVEDLLFDGRRFRTFSHPRIATRATHGTGCILSAAIAARLALGASLPDAVGGAIGYLEEGLRAGMFPGRGWGTPGRFAPASLTPSKETGKRAPGRRIPRRR